MKHASNKYHLLHSKYMDLLFKKQSDFILSRGCGIKACLFDTESRQFISNIIPYSKFQDCDFFYFDYITNKDRIPISDISCIIILRPTSLKSLIEELSSPFYSSYIVLFTGQIDPYVLEILANADTKGLISEIHEIYLDLARQSSFLYTTNSRHGARVLDGLFSLVMSLEIIPSIRFIDEHGREDADGRSLPGLARELAQHAQQYNFRRAGTVVLLKRGFDLISPLVCDWHYQALISEHLSYGNGTVRIENREYSVNDAFFEKNRFSNIHTVGGNIRTVVQELERNRIKISNHEFEDIEEKAAHSLMVETHLTLYNAVLEMCMQDRELSEREIGLLKNGSSDIAAEIEAFSEDKRLKLVLMHFIRSVSDWAEESKLFPRYRDALLRFHSLYRPIEFPYKPTFSSGRDVKLSYEPPLRKLVKHLALDKVRQGALQSINDENAQPGPIIIYIEGGVSMGEYREAMLQAAELGTELYIVSDKITSYKSILNEIIK